MYRYNILEQLSKIQYHNTGQPHEDWEHYMPPQSNTKQGTTLEDVEQNIVNTPGTDVANSAALANGNGQNNYGLGLGMGGGHGLHQIPTAIAPEIDSGIHGMGKGESSDISGNPTNIVTGTGTGTGKPVETTIPVKEEEIIYPDPEPVIEGPDPEPVIVPQTLDEKAQEYREKHGLGAHAAVTNFENEQPIGGLASAVHGVGVTFRNEVMGYDMHVGTDGRYRAGPAPSWMPPIEKEYGLDEKGSGTPLYERDYVDDRTPPPETPAEASPPKSEAWYLKNPLNKAVIDFLLYKYDVSPATGYADWTMVTQKTYDNLPPELQKFYKETGNPQLPYEASRQDAGRVRDVTEALAKYQVDTGKEPTMPDSALIKRDPDDVRSIVIEEGSKTSKTAREVIVNSGASDAERDTLGNNIDRIEAGDVPDFTVKGFTTGMLDSEAIMQASSSLQIVMNSSPDSPDFFKNLQQIINNPHVVPTGWIWGQPINQSQGAAGGPNAFYKLDGNTEKVGEWPVAQHKSMLESYYRQRDMAINMVADYLSNSLDSDTAADAYRQAQILQINSDIKLSQELADLQVNQYENEEKTNEALITGYLEGSPTIEWQQLYAKITGKTINGAMTLERRKFEADELLRKLELFGKDDNENKSLAMLRLEAEMLGDLAGNPTIAREQLQAVLSGYWGEGNFPTFAREQHEAEVFATKQKVYLEAGKVLTRVWKDATRQKDPISGRWIDVPAGYKETVEEYTTIAAQTLELEKELSKAKLLLEQGSLTGLYNVTLEDGTVVAVPTLEARIAQNEQIMADVTYYTTQAKQMMDQTGNVWEIVYSEAPELAGVPRELALKWGVNKIPTGIRQSTDATGNPLRTEGASIRDESNRQWQQEFELRQKEYDTQKEQFDAQLGLSKYIEEERTRSAAFVAAEQARATVESATIRQEGTISAAEITGRLSKDSAIAVQQLKNDAISLGIDNDIKLLEQRMTQEAAASGLRITEAEAAKLAELAMQKQLIETQMELEEQRRQAGLTSELELRSANAESQRQLDTALLDARLTKEQEFLLTTTAAEDAARQALEVIQQSQIRLTEEVRGEQERLTLEKQRQVEEQIRADTLATQQNLLQQERESLAIRPADTAGIEAAGNQAATFTAGLNSALTASAASGTYEGVAAAMAAPLPPTPSGLVWDTNRSTFVQRSGFEGREMDAMTQQWISKVAPAFKARDRAEFAVREATRISQELQSRIAERRAADEDFRQAMLTGQIDSAEEAVARQRIAETRQIENETKMQNLQMLFGLIANPVQLAFAKKHGLIGQIETALGFTIPNIPTSTTGLATPTINEWQTMDNEQRQFALAEFVEQGGSAETFMEMIAGSAPAQVQQVQYGVL